MSERTGLWMIGAHGGVATTVAIGLSALRQNQVGPAGLVSSLPPFRELELVDWGNVVLGGHEIRQTGAITEAEKLVSASAIRRDLVELAKPDLLTLNENVRPGFLFNAGRAIENLAQPGFVQVVENPQAMIELIQRDFRSFLDRHQLRQVIVVNLASTEPLVDTAQFPCRWEEFKSLLSAANCVLPSSSLYAIAALEMGLPFVNFTPSLGSNLPALEDLANLRKTCHAGRDGKTGETFLKSVLAPAYAARNLEIMSWVGHNIFGNLDGVVLNDPVNKQTKVKSKDQLLEQMLGYQPQTLVSIEYIQSLGDWKTAWDHIHFKGFLGTPMVMTFTWQGCDSILAAPLVLDLFRFSDLAARCGQTGLLTFLSSFFKSPQGSTENAFGIQYQQLLEWAASISTRSP